MKTILSTLFVAAMMSSCSNQQNPTHGKKGHQCGNECMKMNSVNTAHGEPGHACSDECMKMNADQEETNTDEQMSMKEHVCTDACTDGQHEYLHGEKGHQCSDTCMNMN